MWKINLLKNRIVCIVLSLVAITGSLCGCSDCGAPTDCVQGITFTDALKREVTVPESPERVAALIGSFAEVWQLSGGDVCATAEDAWDDFDLELDECVNLGGAHSPSVEALLSANPDFVIASASTASNVEMKSQLENAGITVAYFDVDSFDDYLHMLDICTDITGRKELFKRNGTQIQEQIESIKTGFKNECIPEEKRKVLMLRASSGSIKAKGSEGTVLGEMLCELGCVNIADSDKSLLENLSIESIIINEPYRIFAVAMGDEKKSMENLDKLIKENPAWASLGAVRENRVHMMDRTLFNLKPNADWAIAYEKLSKILLS